MVKRISEVEQAFTYDDIDKSYDDLIALSGQISEAFKTEAVIQKDLHSIQDMFSNSADEGFYLSIKSESNERRERLAAYRERVDNFLDKMEIFRKVRERERRAGN